jgi:Tol biopolymer transport system component
MRRVIARWMLVACASMFAVLGPPFAQVSGQYFGRNKVQYKTFDFEVLHTDHFDIYFYTEERRGVDVAARMAERWNERLTRLLGHQLSSRQALILYAASTDFQQTNVVSGHLGEGTGGVTESLRRRIVLPLAGPLADTDHVVGHELVHAFQYDIAAARTQGGRHIAGIGALPLWFIEGMAEYLSIGARSPLTAMWMRDAVANEKLPSIRDLGNPRYFPYRWGHALWAYIGGRWGDRAVKNLLLDAIDLGSPARAFQTVLGLDENQLSAEWHAALRRAYQGFSSSTKAPGRYARPLTPAGGLGNELNVSPALSPDGRRVAFLSERSLFSVDLYIADAATGENVRRLTSTAVDPHFESLQFISSAGTWDPTGRELAITAVANGRPALVVYDTESARRVREISLGTLDGALNPTWSPDGKRVAFVGMTGGLTDLFVIELTTGKVERLTNDAFAELHPAWSPDGRSIALATDRFTTTLDTAAPGPFRLGVLEVRTRTMHEVATFDRGKAIAPQWSRDGQALYFVADPNGISNVYRVNLADGGLRQVTDLVTGVSGITESSPAISAGGDRLALSVFESGAYRLYSTDDARVLEGQLPTSDAADAALLPPTAQPRPLTALLSNPTLGLPPAPASLKAERYRPRLQLDYFSQSTLTVGANRFGSFGTGGFSLFMSDLLGDRSLATWFQATTTFDEDFSSKDLGGAVMYQNLRHRWNWAVEADQMPYRTGFASAATTSVEGTPAVVEQTVIFRQTDRGMRGVAAYPFSRAQRIEGSVGFRNLSFDRRVRTTGYSLLTGEMLFDDRQTVSTFPTLNLAQGSAALVYDTASFGATSPVLGQRYRFEVLPTFGTLRYTGVLLDYRRYFMPVRLYTIAARVMHYGRYGGDSEDTRLYPLFIGYPSLVRGYDVGTFKASECPPTEDGGCPVFDRLLGSRVLVGNLELRFPLLRPFGLREGVYGPVPMEVALFADGGLAWTREDKPTFAGGDRRGVSSVGAAVRINVFGFLIAQVNAARPLQRPGRGWVYQFSLSPGF